LTGFLFYSSFVCDKTLQCSLQFVINNHVIAINPVVNGCWAADLRRNITLTLSSDD